MLLALCFVAMAMAYLAVTLLERRGRSIAKLTLAFLLVALVLALAPTAVAGGCHANGGGVQFAPQFVPQYAPAVAFVPQYAPIYQQAAVIQRQVLVQRQAAVVAAPAYVPQAAAAVVVQPGRQVIKQKSVSRVGGRGIFRGRASAAAVVTY